MQVTGLSIPASLRLPERPRRKHRDSDFVHGRLFAAAMSGLDLYKRPWGVHLLATPSGHPSRSPFIQERDLMKITVETNVAAPIEQVWRAYTTPEDIKQWNA